MFNKIYIFLISFIIILFDQLTKFAVSKQLFTGDNVILINKVLSLYKTYNTGAAFSILQNNTLILIIFSIIVSILISIYFIRNRHPAPYLLILGWGFILGGTMGNLIDRIRLGYVIDFIKLDFINFPIFNIADMFINIGAVVILLYLLFASRKANTN